MSEIRQKNFSLLSIFTSPTLKWGYIVSLFVGVIYYTYLHFEEIFQLLNHARLELIGLAFLITILGLISYSFVYYSIFRGLGSHIPYSQALKITSFSLLGKYLPGKVLSFGNFYLFSREMGISKRNIGLSFLLVHLVSISLGFFCGIPLLPILLPSLSYLILLLPVTLIFLLHPKVLRWIIIFIWRWVKKYQKEDQAIDRSFLEGLNLQLYLKCAVLLLVNLVIGGAAFYFTLAAFVPSLTISSYPLCLFGIGLSLTIGFLALFAPAGIGVREGIGLLVLRSIASPEAIIMAMMVFRILSAVVEIGGALISLLFFKNPVSVQPSGVRSQFKDEG